MPRPIVLICCESEEFYLPSFEITALKGTDPALIEDTKDGVTKVNRKILKALLHWQPLHPHLPLFTNLVAIIFIEEEPQEYKIEKTKCQQVFGNITHCLCAFEDNLHHICSKLILQFTGFIVSDTLVYLLSSHESILPSTASQRKVSLFYAGNFAPVHTNHVLLINISVMGLKNLGYKPYECIIYVGSNFYCQQKLSITLDQETRCELISKAVSECDIPCVIMKGVKEDSFDDVSRMPNQLQEKHGYQFINLVGGDSFQYLEAKYGKSICINDPVRSQTTPQDHHRSDVLLFFADMNSFSSTKFRKELKKRNDETAEITDKIHHNVPQVVLQEIKNKGLFPNLVRSSQEESG